MNLRTITLWAVYDHESKRIRSLRQFKHQITRCPAGCVVVRLKGHYRPPRRQAVYLRPRGQVKLTREGVEAMRETLCDSRWSPSQKAALCDLALEAVSSPSTTRHAKR